MLGHIRDQTARRPYALPISSLQEKLAESYIGENQQHFNLIFCLSLFILAIKILIGLSVNIVSSIPSTSAFDYYLDQSA